MEDTIDNDKTASKETCPNDPKCLKRPTKKSAGPYIDIHRINAVSSVSTDVSAGPGCPLEQRPLANLLPVWSKLDQWIKANQGYQWISMDINGIQWNLMDTSWNIAPGTQWHPMAPGLLDYGQSPIKCNRLMLCQSCQSCQWRLAAILRWGLAEGRILSSRGPTQS